MGATTEGQVPAACTEPGVAARWRVCLHEAGHAVAGRRLLRQTARAVVFDDGSGMADHGGNGDAPTSFKEALAVAAGPAAKALADHHVPPKQPLSVPLEITHAEQIKHLRHRLRECLPDHVALARWCIGGIEEQPDRWTKRYNWIQREARIFVARHQQEIVRAAAALFVRGITSLPGGIVERCG